MGNEPSGLSLTKLTKVRSAIREDQTRELDVHAIVKLRYMGKIKTERVVGAFSCVWMYEKGFDLRRVGYRNTRYSDRIRHND